MSTGSDTIWPFPSEGMDDENIFFFAPYLQADAPPPEIFDSDSWDRDWDNNWTPPKSIDTLTVSPCPFTPIGAPSELTISTESSDDYSQHCHSWLDGARGLCCGQFPYSASTMLSDGPPSFGPLPPSPPLHPASAPSDYGIADPSLCAVSPKDLILPMQQITISVPPPAPPPVQTAVETHRQKPPVGDSNALSARAVGQTYENLQSAYCFLLASERKFNMKTHIETHNKQVSKRFVCGTCKRACSRKHDLLRHCHTVHGQAMPPSASRARRRRRSVPKDDLPHEDHSLGVVEFSDDIMALFMDKEL
ncbi:hypothetical protein BC826DRAFT_1108067 [Russula brevipes]|nr:hypothetical protein BC826DRAFT_1108067 [Russula brevipes]